MNKIINIVITIILGAGWKWADVLKSKGYLEDPFWFLAGLTALLFVQQLYLIWPKPVSRGYINKRRGIIEGYLARLLEDYWRLLNSRNRSAPLPRVRINIMLLTVKWWGFSRHLQLYYSYCPPKTIYSNDEQGLKWKKGIGTGGWAWKECMITLYDSKDPKLNGSYNSLSTSQKEIVGDIQSVLSLPIFDDDKKERIVGVLNLDSQANVSDTLFHDSDVVRLAQAYAETLSCQFSVHGVKS
jgi:hypothetical protein